MCKLCFYKTGSIRHDSRHEDTFNHALLELSKIRGTMSFAQWWVLYLISESLCWSCYSVLITLCMLIHKSNRRGKVT